MALASWMIPAVASIGGALLNGQAASKAADAQVKSAELATGEQAREYDLARGDTAPYRDAGSAALGRLNSGIGDMTRGFTTADLENDPIYQKALQWATQQGTQAINRGAAARGGLDSGLTLKGVTDYALGAATQYGNDAFNRFNITQGNQFNRNAALAGIGQTAVGQTSAAGANMANNISANLIGAGNARAASIVGRANAITGGINSAANYYVGQNNLDKILAAGRSYEPYGAYGSYGPYGYGNGASSSNPYGAYTNPDATDV